MACSVVYKFISDSSPALRGGLLTVMTYMIDRIIDVHSSTRSSEEDSRRSSEDGGRQERHLGENYR